MYTVRQREECQTLVDTKMGTLMRTVEHPARLLPPQLHPFCQLLEILGISALGGEEERAQASGCPTVLQKFFPHPMKLSQILYFVAEDSIQCSLSGIELGIPEGA